MLRPSPTQARLLRIQTPCAARADPMRIPSRSHAQPVQIPCAARADPVQIPCDLPLPHAFHGLPRPSPLTGLDLMEAMLTLDPKRRITAKEALAHPYFSEQPHPKPHELMPTWYAPSHPGRPAWRICPQSALPHNWPHTPSLRTQQHTIQHTNQHP